MVIFLLFDDFQDLHGAGLDTDAAGDALGSGTLFLHDHNLHGADLDTLAAADTLLLVDHVNTGLGVLGDGLVLTDLHALAALDTYIGLCAGTLGNNLNAGIDGIGLFVECLGTSLHTLQTSHTFATFFNSELLHKRTLLYILFIDISIIHVYR